MIHACMQCTCQWIGGTSTTAWAYFFIIHCLTYSIFNYCNTIECEDIDAIDMKLNEVYGITSGSITSANDDINSVPNEGVWNCCGECMVITAQESPIIIDCNEKHAT